MGRKCYPAQAWRAGYRYQVTLPCCMRISPARAIRSTRRIKLCYAISLRGILRVEVMAEVTLNGKNLGTLWNAPSRVDVTQAIKAGTNELVIKVVNLWANRQIGRELTCKSNLKTLYGGYALYTEDWGGKLPFGFTSDGGVTWTEAIVNYLIPKSLPHNFLQDSFSTYTQMHIYPDITLPFLQCPEHENSLAYRGLAIHRFVQLKLARVLSYTAVGAEKGPNADLKFGPSGQNWSVTY